LKDLHISSSLEYEKVVFGMLSACMNVCPISASKDRVYSYSLINGVGAQEI
jgi:hypothetical protein